MRESGKARRRETEKRLAGDRFTESVYLTERNEPRKKAGKAGGLKTNKPGKREIGKRTAEDGKESRGRKAGTPTLTGIRLPFYSLRSLRSFAAKIPDRFSRRERKE